MKLKSWIQKNWHRVLEVLLAPLVLLLLGIWFEHDIKYRQEDLAVTQMVDSYFNGIASNLVSAQVIMDNSVVIARSRALFMRLRQLNRKDEIINVLRFISEAKPELLNGDVFEQDPQSDRYFIDLSGVDLSDSDIEIMEIQNLRIWGANFDNSRFYNFECEACGFTDSSFRSVDFTSVSFADSDLTSVDFTGSNIDEVYIEGAQLDRAKWLDGRVCAKNSIGECK